MKQKTGAKFGRNRARNPSSKLQRMRSDRNKRLRIEAAPKGSTGHVCPAHPERPVEKDRVIMGYLVPDLRKQGIPKFVNCPKTGATLDVVV